MPRPKHPTLKRPDQPRSPRAERDTPDLDSLARRFEAFHRAHPKGSLIPGQLRRAVLAVLAGGAPPGAVQRRCHVSTSQLAGWRRDSGRGRGRPREVQEKVVRRFSVVDAREMVARPDKLSSGGQALELRFGPWSVSVRLEGALAPERS